ncbi:hypothetical protein HU200_049020 [Digitaria exilis]|uniref:Uncharacterized protein n=1 Tax=Digitaria exilis TaxID=1010633 RepID=A0A835B5W2_9POAL|nr:hypothetical protein HU200_049020 [Digitaria exilis]
MLSHCNQLVLVGCNVHATLIRFQIIDDNTEQIIGDCASFCSDVDSKFRWWENEVKADASKYCSGIGCCQETISRASKPREALYWPFDFNTSSVSPIGGSTSTPAVCRQLEKQRGARIYLTVDLTWTVWINHVAMRI